MTEVLSSGRDPDQPPRSMPRRPLALGLALIATTGLIGYTVTHQHRRVDPPAAAPVSAPSPRPAAPAELLCRPHCEDVVLRAAAGSGPRGLQLLVDTVPPTLIDATGRRSPGPRVPVGSGEHIESLLPMGAGAVALVQANFVSEPTPLGKVYRVGGSAPATLIGWADAIVQGMDSTVWTTTDDRPTTTTRGHYTLRELDSAGHELARQSQPPQIHVRRATRAGLLATESSAKSDGSYFGSGEKVVLLNSALGNIERVLTDDAFAVLDVTDTRVAWSSNRQPVIEVYDLAPKTLQTIPNVPAYLAPNYGRFSPDQHSLVLGYSGAPPIWNNPDTYGYLQVLDLRTGRGTAVTGLLLPTKLDVALDWSRDGSTVILGVDDRSQSRIAFWRPANRTLTALPTAVTHSDYSRFTYVQLSAPSG